MSASNKGGQIIIEFEAAGFEAARLLLDDLRAYGVIVDDAYGAVPINPTLTRFVARGVLTQDVGGSVQSELGVRFYGDGLVGPVR